jgi:hypothetical protein
LKRIFYYIKEGTNIHRAARFVDDLILNIKVYAKKENRNGKAWKNSAHEISVRK